MVGFDALASSSRSALALFSCVDCPCMEPGAKAETLDARRRIDDASFILLIMFSNCVNRYILVRLGEEGKYEISFGCFVNVIMLSGLMI